MRNNEKVPVMALRNHKRHCRNAQICCCFISYELLKPLEQGNRPDGELGLAVCPRLVWGFGLDIDRDRSLPDISGSGVIPAFNCCGRERSQSQKCLFDPIVRYQYYTVIDDSLW